MFQGFNHPQSNWHQIPNEFWDFDLNPHQRILLLYILRHTWGFSEYDKPKRITLDEFENGRKRADGTRMDQGVNMSRPTIVKHLQALHEMGYLIVQTDDSDKARIRKSYQLLMKTNAIESSNLNSSGLNLNTSGSDLNHRGKKTLPRTEKDTLERHLRNKVSFAPGGASGDAALADNPPQWSFVEYDDPADIPPLYEKPIRLTTPKQANNQQLNQTVADAWQTEPGSFSAKIGKLLTGRFVPSGNKAKDKRDALWIESNVEPGLSVDEIREFGEWIAEELPGPPMSPEKIQLYVGRWRNHEPDADPVPESHVPFDPDKMPKRGPYYEQVKARMDQLLEEML